MSPPAIRVQNLGKQFIVGARASRYEYRTLRDAIVDTALRPMRQMKSALSGQSGGSNTETKNILWALRDVSFNVQQGEVIGVIGRNGAGKSTLLKVLSRITEPTRGRAEVRGRVASLLEVGTGFHPELTGRENIFLNGAILGMSRWEITRKFDEIVGFAEVERFVDTPVKRYSSGMYLRLAFAVAAHLEPEILVIDEVLAVGDASFQHKCLGKMGDVARAGRTVLFVSHNMQAISALTARCLLLAHGCLASDGPTPMVISEYISHAAQFGDAYVAPASPNVPRITRVSLRTSDVANVQIHGEPMDVEFEITTPRAVGAAALSFQVLDSMERPVVHLLVLDAEQPLCRNAGVYRVVCRIPTLRLYIGDYRLRVHFADKRTNTKLQTLDGICPFKVVVRGELRDYYWVPGTAAYVEDHAWSVERIG